MIRKYFKDGKDTEIENNNRLSKFNYSTWKIYCIENVLLEKIILYNYSMYSS